jgi:hypothetical protein
MRPRPRKGDDAIAAVQAGERVKESGDFYCTICNAKVYVTKGDRIPRCPQGHHEFYFQPGQSGSQVATS